MPFVFTRSSVTMRSEFILKVPRLPRTPLFPPRCKRGRQRRAGRRQPTDGALRPRPPLGSQEPRLPGYPRGRRARGRREGVGLPLQLLLLVNLQPQAPAALGLLRHFGAHRLPALFGERRGRRVTARLGVELPAGAPGTRRLRRWRWPEPLQGRAAGRAGAPSPLRGGPGARRATAVPGVERDVEGPRALGPAQGQGARRQAGARAHHVRDPPHPAVHRGREQPCPEQEPPPEPGPRHRGPQPAPPAPAPAPGRAARPVRPPTRTQAPPRTTGSPGKAGRRKTRLQERKFCGLLNGPRPQPKAAGRRGRGGGGERGAREGRGEGRGPRKVRVRSPRRRRRGCRARDPARVGEGGCERAGRSAAARAAKSLKSFSRRGTECQI